MSGFKINRRGIQQMSREIQREFAKNPVRVPIEMESNSQILWIGSRQATSDTGVSGEGSGVMSTGRSRSLPLWNTA
ncbi:hypothetical protein IU418_28905, partial [Nocardia farcinica]|nr:hypothetical protein [Nocardia farcinica]